MKIAILVFSFPPKWLAGTEIAAGNLAEQLARRGHEVHILTSHDEGLPEFNQERGFAVHRIPFPRIGIIGIMVFWLKILLVIRKNRPDIVHAQDLRMGYPAWLIKKTFKIPYIIWGRGEDVNNPDLLLRLTTRVLLRNAGAILALTEAMRMKMWESTSRTVEVIPNGIEITMADNHAPDHVRNEAGYNIIFIGRLIPVKGIPFLLEAMTKVLKRIPEAGLTIVGDGEERDRLKQLTLSLGIEKSVRFIGTVPHEKIQACLQRAEVFVLPSISEGFPNVIAEAMSAGLPVVASRAGGIPDIIVNNENGYLVETGDTDALADRIILLLQDESLRKTIAENNRLRVKEFTWGRVIDKLERIYSTVKTV
jgi:glycosyltransferase involved in cell wall biosynthesis